jgi:hypothetical protein
MRVWRKVIEFVKIVIKNLQVILGSRPKGRLGFDVGPVENKVKCNGMQAITITNEQQVIVTLNPVTATGKPAKIDGIAKWEVQSGDSRVEVSEDGRTATIISSDSPGITSILVTADADLGEGEERIQDIIDVTVQGAKAASLHLVFGEATPKPGQ